MPTYLYWGEEDFSIDLAVKKLRNKLLDPDWAAFNHKVLDAPSVQEVIESVSTIPMGFGDVLVEVHNLNLFSRKSKSTETQSQSVDSSDKNLIELLEMLPNLLDRVNLLFVVVFPRNSKKKIDKGLKTTKAFMKCATIQHFDSFKTWDQQKVVSWIKDAAKDQNININHDAAIKLFEVNGPELRKLNSELNKLSTYVGDKKVIKKEDVELLCYGIDNVFLLLELWVNGKTRESINELYKILDKDHPIKLIATLHTLINQWLQIKLELNQGTSSIQLSRELGMHQFVVNNAITKTKQVSAERLSHLREQLTKYEYKIKSGQLKAELALEILMTI